MGFLTNAFFCRATFKTPLLILLSADVVTVGMAMGFDTASLLERSHFLLARSGQIMAELDKVFQEGHVFLRQNKSTMLTRPALHPAIIRL
jgi:hypothetical protein